jgi:DNA-directed RNA polymerase subunit omega
MLIYPSIDDLLEKVNSKYSLATLAAKRAHDFEEKSDTQKRELLEEYQTISPVGKALEEVASGDLVIDPESVDNAHL